MAADDGYDQVCQSVVPGFSLRHVRLPNIVMKVEVNTVGSLNPWVYSEIENRRANERKNASFHASYLRSENKT